MPCSNGCVVRDAGGASNPCSMVSRRLGGKVLLSWSASSTEQLLVVRSQSVLLALSFGVPFRRHVDLCHFPWTFCHGHLKAGCSAFLPALTATPLNTISPLKRSWPLASGLQARCKPSIESYNLQIMIRVLMILIFSTLVWYWLGNIAGSFHESG